MPTRQAPKSATPPKATPSKAGSGLDLSGYRRTTAAAPAPTAKGGRATDAKNAAQKADRAKRPKASWDDLVGIEGLRILDSFEEEDDDYGEYVGTIVRIPAVGDNPQTDVIVLTNSSTRAGKKLTRAHAAGKFDLCDGEGGGALPVEVRAKISPQHPEGRPMVLLRIGSENDGEASD